MKFCCLNLAINTQKLELTQTKDMLSISCVSVHQLSCIRNTTMQTMPCTSVAYTAPQRSDLTQMECHVIMILEKDAWTEQGIKLGTSLK